MKAHIYMSFKSLAPKGLGNMSYVEFGGKQRKQGGYGSINEVKGQEK